MAKASTHRKYRSSYTVAIVSVEAYHRKSKPTSSGKRKSVHKRKVCR